MSESEFFFVVWHKSEHSFGVLPLLHRFFSFLLSFSLHFFLSASALQSFGDGVEAMPRARPRVISEMSTTTSRVADGAAALKLRAASRYVPYGNLSICVDRLGPVGLVEGLGSDWTFRWGVRAGYDGAGVEVRMWGEGGHGVGWG